MRSTIAAALALAALLSGCGRAPEATPTPTPAPAACDAGDAAFVTRAMPLFWGRRAHGAGEVGVWTAATAALGREAVAEAMARGPEYAARWRAFIIDALAVARTGDRASPACFGAPLLPEDDGALADFVADSRADGPPWGAPFNMADLIRSALQADDLSVVWRAALFARMAKPVTGANVGPRELENNRRLAFGDEFYDAWLGRNLTCLTCHNSEFSTTDADDPAADRFWPVPGLFERALLGSSFGRDRDSAYAVFRYHDLLRSPSSTAHPFGLTPACGNFTPPGALGPDELGHEGYFIEAFGEAGSVWQVEAYLKEGVDALRGGGLAVAADGEVDGPEAFAWLVGQSIVDAVWADAAGAPLTIATGFPRNQAQRDRLAELTADFVESGFSLRALLVDIATLPELNLAPPERCGGEAYALQPVYDPWSIAEADPDRRMNSPGDQIHRLSARQLIRSVHSSLGWAQPSEFLAQRDPLLSLQTALGAWMRTSQPGFTGTDLQGALAFEATYGACARPAVGGASDGCVETPGFAGCASCTCQDCVCALDAYCCDVQWDALCVSMCDDDCGGCGGGLATSERDAVDRLLDKARDADATVGELALALKDRLLSRAVIEGEERALVEALLGVPWGTRLADAPEVEPALRVLCGALLLSPDAYLMMSPEAPGPVPALSLDVDVDCRRAQALLADAGYAFSCEGSAP